MVFILYTWKYFNSVHVDYPVYEIELFLFYFFIFCVFLAGAAVLAEREWLSAHSQCRDACGHSFVQRSTECWKGFAVLSMLTMLIMFSFSFFYLFWLPRVCPLRNHAFVTVITGHRRWWRRRWTPRCQQLREGLFLHQRRKGDLN